jgi:dual-specificity kinase
MFLIKYFFDCLFYMFINNILKNKYVILKLLGKGNTGSVYLTYDLTTRKYLAIKISDIETYDDLYDEYETYKKIKKKISNNFIVSIYDGFDITIKNNNYYCLTMELYQYTLYDIIRKVSFDSKLCHFNNIFKQILLIINEFHKHKMIICDLKPENILIKTKTDKNIEYYNKLLFNNTNKLSKQATIISFLNTHNSIESDESDDSDVISLSDTDSVYSNNDDILNQYTKIVLTDFEACLDCDQDILYPETYTQYYYPPECILKLSFDTAYDIWSLGCIIYEYITGDVLFNANTNRDHLYQISNKINPFDYDYIKTSAKYEVYFQALTTNVKPVSIKLDNHLIELKDKQNCGFIYSIIQKCLCTNKNMRPNTQTLLAEF